MTGSSSRHIARGGPATVRPASLRRIARLLAAAVVAASPGVALHAGKAAAATAPVGCTGARGAFADSLAAILGAGALRGAPFGVLAVSQDRGDTLLASGEASRFIPASNMKLFTIGALLLERGPAWRGSTRVSARGRVRRSGRVGGVEGHSLRGDLALRPAGLPDVVPLLAPGSKGVLDSLADRLHQSGLTRFEGVLWIDRSLFAEEPPPPGWAHDDLAYSYGAPLGPFLANGNAVLVTARDAGDRVVLTLEPATAPLDVRDGGITIGPPDGGGRLTPRWRPGTKIMDVTGTIPRGGEVRRGVAMADPDSSAAVLFLDALRSVGVRLGDVAVAFVPPRGGAGRREPRPRAFPPDRGSVRDDSTRGMEWEGVGEESLSVVALLPTPTLAEIASAVEPHSLNIETEAALRMLDPAPAGKRRREGLRELTRLVSAAGIDTSDAWFVDGSGLSPQNLITPRAVVRWLTYLDSLPATRGVFRRVLTEPGAPGTLENRFLDLPKGTSLRAKTGTLTNVSSLAGYLTTAQGERLVFSLLRNGAGAAFADARDAESRLVNFLARIPADRATAWPPPARVPR